MRSKRAIAVSVVLAVAGGCANGSATSPSVSQCPPWLKPITLSLDDRLTETTELAILNHNDKFEAFCRE